jgi:hypothetical protein
MRPLNLRVKRHTGTVTLKPEEMSWETVERDERQ